MLVEVFFKDLSERGQEKACAFLEKNKRKLTEEMRKNLEPVFSFKFEENVVVNINSNNNSVSYG